jgi:hypothetical protein
MFCASSRKSPLNQKRKEPREKEDNNKQFTLSSCAGDKFAFVSLFWLKNNNSKVLFARARIMACDKKQAATNANRQMDLSPPPSCTHIYTHTRKGSFCWVRTHFCVSGAQSTCELCRARDRERRKRLHNMNLCVGRASEQNALRRI